MEPSSGGFVDSYTVRYSATVRNCNISSVNTTARFMGTATMLEITGLEEDSMVMGTVEAENIQGTVSVPFIANTSSAGMYYETCLI